MQALTREQVKLNMKQQEARGLRDISIRVMVNGTRKEFFFVDGHGYYNQHRLPGNWTPCSTYLPMEVVPRPGLEDGIIVTLEDFLHVFHQGYKEINPVDLYEPA
jgi:hypothetical protein